MRLILILLSVLLKIESKPITYITTDEGLTSHVFQVTRLWGKAQVVHRSIVVTNYASYHYPDVKYINICDLFILPDSITCTNISNIEIAKRHHCIIIQNKDHWSGKPLDYMLPENTTNNPHFNVTDVDCVAGHMRRIDGILPKGHQLIPSCNISISKYYYDMLPDISKELNISTQNLVVFHWRRGDQLDTRCIQNSNSIHNFARDKSINCHSVEQFINLTKSLLLREKIPNSVSVLIATNEKSPQQLDTLHTAGYKTMSLLKNKINYQNLTSLNLFMLDLTMMMESTWFFEWGITEIQSFVQNILNRKSIRGKFAYYNNVLDY